MGVLFFFHVRLNLLFIVFMFLFQILEQDGLQQQVGGDKRKASDDCDANKDLKKVKFNFILFFMCYFLMFFHITGLTTSSVNLFEVFEEHLFCTNRHTGFCVLFL